MKKFFIAILAILFVSGAVYAAELELSGSYYVRGTYVDNGTGQLDDDDDVRPLDPDGPAEYEAQSYYDHELDISGSFIISDETFVNFRLELLDADWGRASDGSLDDNIEVQRGWGGHTFVSTGTKLETGLMTGGGWASAFGETTGGRYRIKATQTTSFGALVGVVEKSEELGDATEDSEADDEDTFLIALVTKVGDINVLPAIALKLDGSYPADRYDDETDTIVQVLLGADGAFGDVDFVFEFNYIDATFDSDTPAKDFSVWGAFLDVGMTMDALNFGGFLAYGSVDDEQGVPFSFGDDFDGNGGAMMGNQFAFGAPDAIGGSTYLGAYIGYAVSDALSLSAHVGYAMANDDLESVTAVEDDTAVGLTAGGSYKISDAVTYAVGGGYGQISKDTGSDPDAVVKAWHKITYAF